MPAFTYPLAWIAALTLPALGHLFFAPPLPSPTGFQPVALAIAPGIARRRPACGETPMAHGVLSRVTDSRPAGAGRHRTALAGAHTTRPLIVVLDDSQSMLAGPEGERPRDRAIEKLEELTKERRFRSFQLIAAGTTPRLLGDKARHLRELEDQFEQWTCQAPQARLNAALGLARAMGHQEADLLVLTDEAPARSPGQGHLRWVALGQPRINFAFINAARSVHGAEDRVLLEIANPSALTGTNTLRVVAGTNVLHQETLTLATNKTHRLTFPIAAHTPKLQATLRARCPCRR